MEAVRRTVELGRAARAQAKVKMRQPLRKAVSSPPTTSAAAIERARRDRRRRAEREGARVRRRGVRARLLPGEAQLPRARAPLRQEMPQVAAAVEALDAAHVAERAGGRRRGRDLDRRPRPHPDRRRRHPGDGAARGLPGGGRGGPRRRARARARRRAPAEGLAREIVHAVQNARKDAGLEVSDRIELALGGDDELLDAARAHEAYVTGETLATSVAYDGDGSGSEGDDRGPRAADLGLEGRLAADQRSAAVDLLLSLRLGDAVEVAVGRASSAIDWRRGRAALLLALTLRLGRLARLGAALLLGRSGLPGALGLGGIPGRRASGVGRVRRPSAGRDRGGLLGLGAAPKGPWPVITSNPITAAAPMPTIARRFESLDSPEGPSWGFGSRATATGIVAPGPAL